MSAFCHVCLDDGSGDPPVAVRRDEDQVRLFVTNDGCLLLCVAHAAAILAAMGRRSSLLDAMAKTEA